MNLFDQFLNRERSALASGAEQLKTGVKRKVLECHSLLSKLNEKQAPDMYLSSPRLHQGEALSVLVAVPQPRTPLGHVRNFLSHRFGGGLVKVAWDGKAVPMHLKSNRSAIWRALIPTSPLDEPAVHKLDIHVEDGRHTALQIPIEVEQHEYPTQSIWLSPEKSHLTSDWGATAVDGATQTCTPQQFWDGPFRAPARGPVTTPYGVRRYYNGVWAEQYYHRGLDYGAPEGQAVTAPAAGRVTLVGEEANGFAVQGNCVCIDHGQGVVSVMMHLKEASVQPRDTVKAGDVIGQVGETGLATGPHLHWGLFVGGTSVDPLPWMASDSYHKRRPLWAC